jgi:hypothetical protein
VVRPALATVLPLEMGSMSQREIERVIGRLVTDEEFRREFEVDPGGVLRGLVERGLTLSGPEVAALAATPADVWRRAAEALDPRLQKVSLKRGRSL